MSEASDATEVFLAHRNLLFTVAYEMLGSAADAEDVLQETWLRWADRVDGTDQDEVRDPRAYLVRITTRLSLNRIRSLARRRESYVGPWLPEPLLTSPDVAEDVELADSVSRTVSIAIETLSASSTSSATSGLVSSGSGSHSPTYSSRRRASVRSRFSPCRVTIRTR